MASWVHSPASGHMMDGHEPSHPSNCVAQPTHTHTLISLGEKVRSHFGAFFFHLHTFHVWERQPAGSHTSSDSLTKDMPEQGQVRGGRWRDTFPGMMSKLPWLALNKSTWLRSFMIYDNLLFTPWRRARTKDGVSWHYNVSYVMLIWNTWKRVEISDMGGVISRVGTPNERNLQFLISLAPKQDHHSC